MSFNKYMHPRNLFYNNPPDFGSLAILYPDFSSYLIKIETKKPTIDFKNADSLSYLYTILMRHYFNLKTYIPNDHLIPRIPQRLNYILWIEDLLERPIKAFGFDIGCGASCVFDILACTMNKEWRMIASDMNDDNLKWARENVEMNSDLKERIQIIKVSGQTIFNDLFNDLSKYETFDFMMCNPPFFSDESENSGKSSVIRKPEKRHAPSSVNTQKLHESVYSDGGEVGFVKKMIDESFNISNRIKIFTTMLGKKSSLIELKNYLLRVKNISNISETQFCQGHTMRWGISWSYQDKKLNQFEYFKKKEPKPKPFIYEINKESIKNQSPLNDDQFYYEHFKGIMLNDLKLTISKENSEKFQITLSAYDDTWSNQRAKRRKLLNGNEKKPCQITQSNNEPILNFMVQLNSINNSKLTLELSTDYPKNREALNQILQYLKNKTSNI